MILITGATGFIGRRLLEVMNATTSLPIRILLKPGSDARVLPRGIPFKVVSGSIVDEASLRVAMDGVHTIIHLAGTDNRGRHASLDSVDIEGAKIIVKAAKENHVGRIITLSRIGADRRSGFPILKAKGEIEDAFIDSGMAYTIFRSSVIFGKGDHFSENIAMIQRVSPIYFVPGDGAMTLQPLWVDDLVTCLLIALEDHSMIDNIIPIGGPEVLSYRRIVMRVMYAMGTQKAILSLPTLIHKWGAWYLDGLFQRWPYTENFVDLISSNQTAELGLLERRFGFKPAAFDLAVLRTYLESGKYTGKLMRYIFSVNWGK